MNKIIKRGLAALLCALMLLALLPASFGGIQTAEAAGTSTAKVYPWYQGDSKWINKYKDKSWWSKACAVVAIAVQIARTDLVRVNENASSFNTSTKEGFNPATFAMVGAGKCIDASDAHITNWKSVKNAVPGFVWVKKDSVIFLFKLDEKFSNI